MTALDPEIDDAPPRDLTPAELDALEAANRANGHRAPAPTLPADIDAEEAALGAALLSPDAITQATDAGLTSRHFQRPSHQLIWQAIAELHDDDQDVDVVTVADHLAHAECLDRAGGPGRLLALQRGDYLVGHARTYARQVLSAHQRRQVMVDAAELTEIAQRGPADLTAALTPVLERLTATTTPTTTVVDFEDVGAVLRGDYEPLVRAFLERTDGEALIYPGLLHWLFSTPGIGKTWLAIAACAESIKAGIDVIYLDWEGNRRLVGLRLKALGVTDEDVDARFHYLRAGAIDATKGRQLGTWATEHGVGLVIFDGFAKALAACGHDEDKSGPVLQYLHDAVDPFTRQGDGAAVLMLDHVTKDKETRGLWPRGSGAKQGEVSGAAWLLRTRKAFNRQTAGVLELVQAKDREGEVGIDGQVVATVHLDPQPDTGRLAIRLDPPITTTTADGGFRPTIYMERISRWVENENRFNRHPGHNEIIDGVEGKKAYLVAALKALVDEGHLVVDTTTKTHGHNVARPYREDDELHADPDQETLP